MNSADNSAHKSWVVAALATGLALIAYLPTASRSVGWHDSAELALTAWALGASHAPGSPLHSLLGYLATLLAQEPAAGTTYLSVIAGSLSVATLALLVYAVWKNTSLAILVALVYAFSFQVWASAVITEVYSLGMMLLAFACLFGWFWRVGGSRVYFAAMLCFYALSLGAYFGNILLLPAFIYLIWMAAPNRARYLFLLAVTMILACTLIGIANLVLAKNLAPSGDVFPDSLSSMLLYMSGSQHEPLEIESLSFLGSRIIEHTLIIAKSVLYIGVPLALAGIYYFDKIDRVYGYFLFGVFAIYTGYYTIFGPGDYFMMIIPAYFVMGFWIACGIVWLGDRFAYLRSGRPDLLLPVILILGLLLTQFQGRRYMALDMGPERLAEAAFVKLPKKAVAIAGWKEFAVLNYFQTTRQRRMDIRFVVPARTQRIYTHGLVDDYLNLVDMTICDSPVFSLKQTPELLAAYRLIESEEIAPWYKLEPPEYCAPKSSAAE